MIKGKTDAELSNAGIDAAKVVRHTAYKDCRAEGGFSYSLLYKESMTYAFPHSSKRKQRYHILLGTSEIHNAKMF